MPRLSCPDCGERLIKKWYSRYVTQLECNSCKKEFDDRGRDLENASDPPEIDDLIELYQEIGGEG